MRPVLVLRPIGRVAERLAAARILARVRLLAGVRPQMGLQVLQPRVRLAAALELYAFEKVRKNSGQYFWGGGQITMSLG